MENSTTVIGGVESTSSTVDLSLNQPVATTVVVISTLYQCPSLLSYTVTAEQVPLVITTLSVSGSNFFFNSSVTGYNESVHGSAVNVSVTLPQYVSGQVSSLSNNSTFTSSLFALFSVPETITISVFVPSDSTAVQPAIYSLGLASISAASSIAVLAGAAAGGAVILIAAIVAAVYFLKRRKKKSEVFKLDDDDPLLDHTL